MSDELIAELDQKHTPGGWELWRTAIGGWCVRVRVGNLTASAETLQKALQEAVKLRQMTVVPHKPQPFSASDCTVRKSGSKWALGLPTGGTIYSQSTKRKAMETAERLATASQEMAVDWHAKWDQVVQTGEQGVDWIWG